MDNKKLKFYTVTEEYMIYLKKYDEKVMDNRGVKNKRPYIGVLFEIDRKKYLAPLSSPKPKHLTMKNSLDFVKINQGKFGVINLNNMIPVSLEYVKQIDFSLYDEKYVGLLKKQAIWINKNSPKIKSKTLKLYNFIVTRENTIFHKRSNDFRLLEEKSLEYFSKK